MKAISILLLLCFSKCLIAQKDSIIVNKDVRLNVISKKQNILNRRAALTTSNGLYKGYRLQVLVTNDRNLAFSTKAKLLTNFPNHKAYIMYQSPNFKVRFGNFLKRGEAEQMRKQLQKQFTGGVYIVDEAVEYHPIGDEDVE